MPLHRSPIVAFFRVTRAWNLIILVLAQYLTACFLMGRGMQVFSDVNLFMLAFSTGLIAAAGYIINDYYDIKIDFVNKPDRVVVGKTIPRRYALFLHSLQSVAGISIGFLISWKIGILHFLSVFLLWLYSNNLKRQPLAGNVAVGLLTGLSIFVVEVLYNSNNALVIIYAVFAFFMTLVREIIKDMEDLKGDNTFGCQTLPIVWGVAKTKYMVYSVIAALLITVLVINGAYIQLPLLYFLIFLFIPLTVLVLRLYRADTTKDFAGLSSFCKIIMLLGMLSMIFV
jgi:4-hydroxybenzoate polyprenyltransferase